MTWPTTVLLDTTNYCNAVLSAVPGFGPLRERLLRHEPPSRCSDCFMLGAPPPVDHLVRIDPRRMIARGPTSFLYSFPVARP